MLVGATQFETAPVSILVLVTIGVAIVGSLIGAIRGTVGSRPTMRERQWIHALAVLVALVGFLWEPSLAIFWLVLALNALLGGPENIPFSWFSMFSALPPKTWSLGFEDTDGNPVPVAKFGLMPTLLKKRFGAELAAAPATEDRGTALVEAGRPIIELIEGRRPVGGQWASGPIRVVFIEFRIENGAIAEERHLIGEVAGR